MKIRFKHILVISGIFNVCCLNLAYAQDAAFPVVEFNNTYNDESDAIVIPEKVSLSPGDGDHRYSTSKSVNTPTKESTNNSKDSSTNYTPPVTLPKIRVEKTPPPIKPAVEKQSKQEEADDSVLSFNFLYYIIQKYKMQDIVD